MYETASKIRFYLAQCQDKNVWRIQDSKREKQVCDIHFKIIVHIMFLELDFIESSV